MKSAMRNAFLAATVLGALSLTACKSTGGSTMNSPSESPPPVSGGAFATPAPDPAGTMPPDSSTTPPPETPTSGAPTTP